MGNPKRSEKTAGCTKNSRARSRICRCRWKSRLVMGNQAWAEGQSVRGEVSVMGMRWDVQLSRWSCSGLGFIFLHYCCMYKSWSIALVILWGSQNEPIMRVTENSMERKVVIRTLSAFSYPSFYPMGIYRHLVNSLSPQSMRWKLEPFFLTIKGSLGRHLDSRLLSYK